MSKIKKLKLENKDLKKFIKRLQKFIKINMDIDYENGSINI